MIRLHDRPTEMRRRLLQVSAAPLALALALSASVGRADPLPVPYLPPPDSGTNWVEAQPGPTYDSNAVSADVEVGADRAYAEWSEFNIDVGHTLNIVGQQSDWILVNRVVSDSASTLAGTINANGQVWLINPNGIVATNSAVFNVGGLLLSTAQTFDAEAFVQPGSLSWQFYEAAASIRMDGKVNASHGVVALLAPQISVGSGSPNTSVGEVSPGSAQFVAIAAQDVSLTFTDVSTVFQLDGATILGAFEESPFSNGGFKLLPNAQIKVGRIFIAAAGRETASQILISGGLTATQARGDGQDIVLMTSDLVADVDHVIAQSTSGQPPGQVVLADVTTTTGGDITFDPSNINTIAGVVDPDAAPGASVMIASAGNTFLGEVANPVGDVDVLAIGDIAADEGGGNVSARDIALESFGSITVNDLRARDDVVVRVAGAGGFSAGSILTGQVIFGEAPTDPLLIDSTEAGERLVARTAPFSLEGVEFDLLGHDIDVIAPSVTITGAANAFDNLAQGAGESDVRLQSYALGVTTSSVSASRDVVINARGDVDAGALIAGRDVSATPGNGKTLKVASADAQDDIVFGGSKVVVTGNLTTHGVDHDFAVETDQAGDLLAAGTPVIAFSPGGVVFETTGSDIDVLAGSISVGGVSTAQGPGSDARFQADGAISLGAVTADRDVLIDAGLTVATGALTAGRDIGARSLEASVTIASGEAQDDIVLRGDTVQVTGGLTTHGVDHPFASEVDQAGDLLVAVDPISAFGSSGPTFNASGSNLDVKAGSITVGGASVAAGVDSDARFQATGDIALADTTAGRDVLIDAGGSATVGQGQAGRDFAARALAGSLTIGGASALDDIVLRAGGAISVSGALTSGGSAAASGSDELGDILAESDPVRTYWASTADPYATADGHDIDIRSGGSIALAGVVTAAGAASDIRLDSTGGSVAASTLRLTGGAGGEQVLVAGTDFALSNLIDAPGADVLLFARATSPSSVMIVGGPTTGLGSNFTFDAAEVSRVAARSLNLFSGVASDQTSNIAVQDLQMPASLRTLRLYSGPGTRIEVFGQVTDGGGGDASLVIGAAPSDPALASFIYPTTGRLMADTWTPDVIRLSGGIGVTGPAFQRVTFAAGSIYIAPRNDTSLGSDFEEAVLSTAPEQMPPYAGAARVQLRAGALELRAASEILERNLQPTTFTSFGLGLQIGSLLIDRLDANGATPTRVSLFGELDSRLGGTLPPVPPGGLVGGSVPAFLLRFAPAPKAAVSYDPGQAVAANYLFNGCPFGGGGGCFFVPVFPTTPPVIFPDNPFGEPPFDMAEEALLEAIEDGDLNGEGSSSRTSSGQTSDDRFTPRDDEPVSNTGGETRWPATSGTEANK